jgi:hypothetical protein
MNTDVLTEVGKRPFDNHRPPSSPFSAYHQHAPSIWEHPLHTISGNLVYRLC